MTANHLEPVKGSTGPSTPGTPPANLSDHQAGKSSSGEASTDQAETEFASELVDSTTFYLDGNGSPTGYASTNNTSNTRPSSPHLLGTEHAPPRCEAPPQSDEGHSKTQTLRLLSRWRKKL